MQRTLRLRACARIAVALVALLGIVGGASSVADGAGPGLVAAYGFDTASSSASDSSGNANHGSVSGSSWTSGGRYGGALSFDGVNDWVTIPHSPSLNASNAITFEAWVKPASTRSWQTVALKESSPGHVYALYSVGGAAGPEAQVVTGALRAARATQTLAAGVWTHLAMTYDSSRLRIYVNGDQAVSVQVSGAIPGSTGALRLGGNAVWGEWFSGSIDEVRVYDRALSAAELQSDMSTPIGGSAPPPADTIAPTAPSNVTITSRTQTSVALSWQASSDNLGVSGYGRYSNGSIVSSGTGTAYTFGGLTCGSSYTFGVDAYDAAGNRSTQSTVTAATIACSTSPPPGAASLFVSANGSDSGSCTQTAPCRTLNRAYQLAAPGATVEVAGGSYPAQTIAAKSSAAAPAVVIRAAGGTTPTFSGTLTVRASHVDLVGPYRATGVSTSNSSTKVRGSTVENIVVDSGGSSRTPGYVSNVDGVTWKNVEIFNAREANALIMVDGGYPARGSVKNLVLDGLKLHDSTIAPGSGTHSQCIFFGGGQGITLRNSRFWNCTTFDVFVTTAGGDLPSNYVMENNMFGVPYLHGTQCCHYYSVKFRDSAPLNGLLFRNNSARQEVGWP
jgi:hypothetical protein